MYDTKGGCLLCAAASSASGQRPRQQQRARRQVESGRGMKRRRNGLKLSLRLKREERVEDSGSRVNSGWMLVQEVVMRISSK